MRFDAFKASASARVTFRVKSMSDTEHVLPGFGRSQTKALW